MTDRSWIWLGIGAGCVIGLGMLVNAFAERLMLPWLVSCGWIVFGIAILLVFASVRELWMDWARWKQDMWARQQHALSETPAVRIAEALRGLHPSAAAVLNKFGVRTQWQVKIEADRSRDWILLGTNVHFGFVEFVLGNSSNVSLYPKRMFSEGSKKWDPDGLTEDREQYTEFELWLQARLMVTRSFGENQAAQFIPPWSPALVLEVMGLDGPQELFQPETPIIPPRENGKDFREDKVKDLIPVIGSVISKQ